MSGRKFNIDDQVVVHDTAPDRYNHLKGLVGIVVRHHGSWVHAPYEVAFEIVATDTTNGKTQKRRERFAANHLTLYAGAAANTEIEKMRRELERLKISRDGVQEKLDILGQKIDFMELRELDKFDPHRFTAFKIIQEEENEEFPTEAEREERLANIISGRP